MSLWTKAQWLERAAHLTAQAGFEHSTACALRHQAEQASRIGDLDRHENLIDSAESCDRESIALSFRAKQCTDRAFAKPIVFNVTTEPTQIT